MGIPLEHIILAPGHRDNRILSSKSVYGALQDSVLSGGRKEKKIEKVHNDLSAAWVFFMVWHTGYRQCGQDISPPEQNLQQMEVVIARLLLSVSSESV